MRYQTQPTLHPPSGLKEPEAGYLQGFRIMDSNRMLAKIEGAKSTLFLVAGGLIIVFSGLLGFEALTNSAAPEDIFGPAGFAVAFVGLLGLYPKLVEETPWIARAGAAFAVAGAVGGIVVSLGSLGSTVGVLPQEPGPVAVLFILGLGVGMLPGYVTFGVASLRAGVHSRLLGLLLLAPPVIFAVMLTGAFHAVTGEAFTAFILSGGQALALLAIGLVLRMEDFPTERAEPAADAAA